MLTMNMVRNALNDDLVCESGSCNENRAFEGILFFDSQSRFLKNILYITDAVELQTYLDAGILDEHSDCTVLCSVPGHEEMIPDKKWDAGNLLFIRKTPREIYNSVYRLILSDEQRRKNGWNFPEKNQQNLFQEMIEDILNGNLVSADDLMERLRKMPAPLYKERFGLITITFHIFPQNFAWTSMLGNLQKAFPNANIAVYQNHVLLFTKQSEWGGLILPEKNVLQKLMEDYDANMAVGTTSKYLTALPTMYQQCLATLRLGVRLCKNPGERIFFYEDYSVYLLIDMCASEHFLHYHHGKLFFLCHQGFIRIERYDRKNHTNLIDVMYAYLANDCNTTRTAKKLFIHRNTLISRIKKIEELLGESLNNSFLQERIRFSYHVKEYVTKYRGEDLFPYSRID